MNNKIDEEIDITSLFDGVLNQNTGIDDALFVNDAKERRIVITDEIEPYSVERIVRLIINYNIEDRLIPVESRRPILIFLSCLGGSVSSGFELIDIIEASKTPVYTINLAYAYSMAFMIGLAGQKRFATKNAKFLVHDGSDGAYGNTSKVRDYMEFSQKVDERLKEYILSKTSITKDEYEHNIRIEWYMFAEQAKKYGIIDSIIGEDCELTDII